MLSVVHFKVYFRKLAKQNLVSSWDFTGEVNSIFKHLQQESHRIFASDEKWGVHFKRKPKIQWFIKKKTKPVRVQQEVHTHSSLPLCWVEYVIVYQEQKKSELINSAGLYWEQLQRVKFSLRRKISSFMKREVLFPTWHQNKI